MIINKNNFLKKLLILILLFAVLYYAKVFLMPLAIGGVLATLFLPLCKWMEGKKFHRSIAVFVCALLFLLITMFLFGLLCLQFSSLMNDIAIIKQRAIELSNQFQDYIFYHSGISVEKQTQFLKQEQPSFKTILQMIVGSLTYFFTNFILIVVYFFGLLYYRLHIKEFILRMVQPYQRSEVEQIIYSASYVSQQYLIGLSKMIVCLWVFYGIGFSFLGVKNPIFFAVLCGLLEIVPFIGNIVGTLITILISAVNGASFPMLAGILVTYGTVQFIQGWVLEPFILGPQVKINPLFTIVSLIIGELLWGISGVLLAIPLTAILKIVFDHFDSLKPIGFLIGEIEVKNKEPDFLLNIKNRLTGIFIKK